jgi:hypothetical protein
MAVIQTTAVHITITAIPGLIPDLIMATTVRTTMSSSAAAVIMADTISTGTHSATAGDRIEVAAAATEAAATEAAAEEEVTARMSLSIFHYA